MLHAAALWRAPLVALLAVACVADVRARRIPNAVVVMVLAVALVRLAAMRHAGGGAVDPALATGLAAGALGALLGLVASLPLYALGVVGAGDVKLFAAVGAWVGPAGLVPAALYTSMAGGVLAAVWIVASRRARTGGATELPYGVAITAGVLGTLLRPAL